MIKILIKKSLKTVFGFIYSDFIKYYKYLVKRLKGGYFSIHSLDKKLEKYVNYDKGFFVELGANDGITQSNSFYFELKRNWRGVLVEPSPHNFLLCKKIRSKKNYIYCNACVGFDFKGKYVDIKYSNLMSISNNLDLDLLSKKDHIKNSIQHLNENEEVFQFGSMAVTLNTLLEKSNAPKIIDFLSLDVEGAELEVLKGIDFNLFSFKYILIEVRNLEKIKTFLKLKQYELHDKFSKHDFLFKKI